MVLFDIAIAVLCLVHVYIYLYVLFHIYYGIIIIILSPCLLYKSRIHTLHPLNSRQYPSLVGNFASEYIIAHEKWRLDIYHLLWKIPSRLFQRCTVGILFMSCHRSVSGWSILLSFMKQIVQSTFSYLLKPERTLYTHVRNCGYVDNASASHKVRFRCSPFLFFLDALVIYPTRS
jgi:hypothetical protein